MCTVSQDSPWQCISVIQAEGFWKDVQLPAGCKCIISVAFSNHTTPGTVTGKPYIECTLDEIKEELLRQINFYQEELIIDWKLDYELEILDAEQYKKTKDTLPGHTAHLRKDGKWMLNYVPLFVPKVDTHKYIFGPSTKLANLYLAGEYIQTDMPVVTMEKASEAGFRAAKILLENSTQANSVEPIKLFDVGIVKFRWIRKLDKLIYDYFHKNDQ